jgi:hypothetical protein
MIAQTVMRIAFYICLIMILFNLSLSVVSGLEDANGNKLFPGFTGGGIKFGEFAIGLSLITIGPGVAVGILYKDIRPIAAGAFAATFLIPAFNSFSILGTWIPSELLNVIVVGTSAVFVVALIGIVSGSG